LVLETSSRKRGETIAATAIVSSLRASTRVNHFEWFAQRDGGWSARVYDAKLEGGFFSPGGLVPHQVHQVHCPRSGTLQPVRQ
jgi:hypothetical protein